MGKFGCRCCKIEGISSQSGRGIYFPLTYPKDLPFDTRNKRREIQNYNINSIVNEERYARKHDEVINIMNNLMDPNVDGDKKENLKRMNGISGKSIFCELPSMRFPNSYPVDFMHAVCINAIKKLWSIWCHDLILEKENEPIPEFVLDKKVINEIGHEMRNGKKFIPGIFGRPPQDICNNWRGFKAEEWKNWCIFYSLPLLFGRLPDKYLLPWA